MGIFDTIFGTGKSTSTSTSSTPNWVQNAGSTNYNLATKIAQTPYTPYGGTRVPQINGLESAAYGAAGDNLAKGPGDYSAALGSIFKGANTGASQVSMPNGLANDYMSKENPYASIDSYMNPYIQGVLAPSIRNVNEASDRARNSLDAQALGAGAFGDARHGIQDSQMIRDERQQIGDMSNQVYGNAFQDAAQRRQQAIAQALGLQQQDITNKLSAEGTNGQFNEAAANRAITGGATGAGITTQQHTNELDNINAAAGAGQAQRQRDQSAADASYQEWLRGQGWDQEQLNFLMSALNGAPYNRTTTTQQPNQSGGLGGILGSILGSAFKG